MLKVFREFISKDQEVSRFQKNVSDFCKQLSNNPTLSSVILKDIILTSGAPLEIPHKLGRELQGWQIIDKTANANVWRVTSGTNKNLFLTLQSNANCTISLLVF